MTAILRLWLIYLNLKNFWRNNKIKMKTVHPFICETPIPKAKRIGIGKLNNPAKRRVQYPAACCKIFSKLALGFIPVIIRPGLFSGGIIALIILLCAGGPAFAARIAGTDENVNTITTPAQSKDAVPKDSPEIKATTPEPSTEVKTENVIKSPKRFGQRNCRPIPRKKKPLKNM
jgi:hypothetical protein